MSEVNCPFCGKTMVKNRVDIGGGSTAWEYTHETEEDDDLCNVIYNQKLKAAYERAMGGDK